MKKESNTLEQPKGKNLKATLAKLNKVLSEGDMFKLASEQPEDYFKIHYLSTGSPYFDYKLQTEDFGGVPIGRTTIVVGTEGSGKTSFALMVGAIMQKTTGKYLVYFDGERTVSESYIDRLGIDRSLFLHYKDNNLERMLDAAQEFSVTEGIGMIVIDSLPMFTSTVVEEKAAEQNTIGIEARKYNTKMPIIGGNCSRYNIALLCINQYRKDPGSMGDPRVMPRGEWQKFHSSLTIDLTKKDLIFDKEKRLIGNAIDVRIKKSKLEAFDKKEFTVNFYYDYGFDRFDDGTALLIETGIIDQAGSWFVLPNDEKIQGQANVADFFRSNEEYMEELLKTVIKEKE